VRIIIYTTESYEIVSSFKYDDKEQTMTNELKENKHE
jgi:hypothetical protein